MPESKTTRPDRTYISRDEFEVFERNVDKSFISVTDAINALTSKIDRMGSTDWKTFGMFAGLILSIVTLAASPFLRDLGRLERNQESIRSNVEAGTGDRWTEDDERSRQAQEMAEHRRLEGKIDEAQKASRVMMDLVLAAPLERLADLEEDLEYWRGVLDGRGEWMANTDKERAAHAAALEARITELERSLREISSEQRRRTERVYDE